MKQICLVFGATVADAGLERPVAPPARGGESTRSAIRPDRRFQQALRTFETSNSRRRGAATAAACGYADQAHFIREFGELAGCSPGAHAMRDAMLAKMFAGMASV